MADDKIILKAEDLDGYLTKQDMDDLSRLEKLYAETETYFQPYDRARIIEQYDRLGHSIRRFVYFRL